MSDEKPPEAPDPNKLTDEEHQAASYFNNSIEILAKAIHRLLGNPAITIAATVSLRRRGEDEARPLTCVATSFVTKEAGVAHVASVHATLERMRAEAEAEKHEPEPAGTGDDLLDADIAKMEKETLQ
jgi:hypothetical protein